jgi:hypothetical protein
VPENVGGNGGGGPLVRLWLEGRCICMQLRDLGGLLHCRRWRWSMTLGLWAGDATICTSVIAARRVRVKILVGVAWLHPHIAVSAHSSRQLLRLAQCNRFSSSSSSSSVTWVPQPHLAGVTRQTTCITQGSLAAATRQTTWTGGHLTWLHVQREHHTLAYRE